MPGQGPLDTRVFRAGSFTRQIDGVTPGVHLTDPARAERRENLVWSKPRTGHEGHFALPTSFWNRGFFRSGSKLGSIFSQPGER